jgi:hypothetical protein
MDTIWLSTAEGPLHARSECPSQALDSTDNEPPFIARSPTFSAKTSPSACRGTVPIAYLTDRCRRQAQLRASTEVRASREGESSSL